MRDRGDRSVARGAVAAATAPRRRWGRLAWLLVGAATALAAWLAGAYVSGLRAGAGAPIDRLTHVHGMDAPAWADGTLLVGTHTGLVRWSERSGWRSVGAGRHDLMGFRADPRDEGTLYASGHRDLRSEFPNPLGLIVSRDGGRTWVQRSLAGAADLHALASTGGGRPTLLAWDATGGSLLRSDDDGATWTATGLQDAPVTAARLLGDGALWAFVLDPDGGLQRSRDGGATWSRVATGIEPGAYVTAIAASDAGADVLCVATLTAEVLHSDDGGITWTAMVVGGEVP